jgi:hypothetical protein
MLRPAGSRGIKQGLRNIHAGFQPFSPQKAHGYCVIELQAT